MRNLYLPRIAKIIGHFQYKIIIIQGQFSTISPFSIGHSQENWYLCCNSPYTAETSSTRSLSQVGSASKLQECRVKNVEAGGGCATAMSGAPVYVVARPPALSPWCRPWSTMEPFDREKIKLEMCVASVGCPTAAIATLSWRFDHVHTAGRPKTRVFAPFM